MKDIYIIEGLDGSGKYTTALTLKQFLEKTYPELNVIMFSIPDYNIFTGKLMKDILYNRVEVGDHIIAKSMPYAINRLEVYELNKKIIEKADIIVFDRSWLSNVIFQSVDITDDIQKTKEYLQWVYNIEIKNTFLEDENNRFYKFNLYHESFDTSRELLHKRQKAEEDDKNESNPSYLKSVAANLPKVMSIANQLEIENPGGKFKKYFTLDGNICASSISGGLRTPIDIATEIYEKAKDIAIKKYLLEE